MVAGDDPPRWIPDEGLILAIETSCDDTCAAVVSGGGKIHSNVIASQGVHDKFGGVVPEVASRQHLEVIDHVVAEALATAGAQGAALTAVAATRGPGLIGALLVGFSSAKAYAAAWEKPLVPVDHLQGHVSANLLQPEPLGLPFICLIASGGHTMLCRVEQPIGYEILGQTVDDAAGEAFDKGARLLGLGFPGGVEIDRLARTGDPHRYAFPRSTPGKLDFSFSGLKTALLYKIREIDAQALEAAKPDLAASYQQAIVDALVARVERAIDLTGIDRVAIGGGVAANSLLRERIETLGVTVKIPARDLCTDNAAMIASAARYLAPLEPAQFLAMDAYPSGAAA